MASANSDPTASELPAEPIEPVQPFGLYSQDEYDDADPLQSDSSQPDDRDGAPAHDHPANRHSRLLFPVAAVDCAIKHIVHRQRLGLRVLAGASLYLTSTLEHVMGEVLVMACSASQENRKTVIHPRHIKTAVGSDPELAQIVGSKNPILIGPPPDVFEGQDSRHSNNSAPPYVPLPAVTEPPSVAPSLAPPPSDLPVFRPGGPAPNPPLPVFRPFNPARDQQQQLEQQQEHFAEAAAENAEPPHIHTQVDGSVAVAASAAAPATAAPTAAGPPAQVDTRQVVCFIRECRKILRMVAINPMRIRDESLWVLNELVHLFLDRLVTIAAQKCVEEGAQDLWCAQCEYAVVSLFPDAVAKQAIARSRQAVDTYARSVLSL